MGKKTDLYRKPNLPKYLFWDFRYDEIQWEEDYLTVMERVLERGSEDDWQQMMGFYGKQKVIEALKYEIKFLVDYAINKVCDYFHLCREELLCYLRKQSRPGHWI